MAISFPLKRRYFNRIRSNAKQVEYRAKTDWWSKRISKLDKGDKCVFLCGQDVLAGIVTKIEEVPTPQDLSAEIVSTETCFAVHFELSSELEGGCEAAEASLLDF